MAGQTWEKVNAGNQGDDLVLLPHGGYEYIRFNLQWRCEPVPSQSTIARLLTMMRVGSPTSTHGQYREGLWSGTLTLPDGRIYYYSKLYKQWYRLLIS